LYFGENYLLIWHVGNDYALQGIKVTLAFGSLWWRFSYAFDRTVDFTPQAEKGSILDDAECKNSISK